MSTEVEYATHLAEGPGSARIPGDLLAKHLPYGLVAKNEFLSNGGRLYKDVGEHLEYAAPECLGPLEATQHEVAGESIMLGIVDLISNIQGNRRVINKRLCDPYGNLWGSHHNFQVGREIFPPLVDMYDDQAFGQRLLASHLATNTVYTGAGMYKRDGSYYLSQKKWRTAGVVTSNTVDEKGLLNKRDEPHNSGHEDEFARLHVQAGEATVSPWATWMQLATFSILLRVIESGWEPDCPMVASAAEAAMDVARDTSLSWRLPLRDSSELSALDVQSEYAQLAVRAKEKGLLSPEESLAADEWECIVADLQQRDTVDCSDRVDWLARQQIVESSIDSKDTGVDPRVRRQELDLVYDRLGPTGIGYMLRERGNFTLRFSEEEIDHAIHNAPETRAKTRAEIVTALNNADGVRINWSTVDVDQTRHRLGRAAEFRPDIARSVIKLANSRSTLG